MERIEVKEGGLVCDNPSCDWENKSIQFDQMGEWLDRPCPKCGENLLTVDDYLSAVQVNEAIKQVNSMTDEDFMSIDTTEIRRMFPDLKEEDEITFSIDMHNGIKFKIQKDGEDASEGQAL